jgi:hypothetical protein
MVLVQTVYLAVPRKGYYKEKYPYEVTQGILYPNIELLSVLTIIGRINQPRIALDILNATLG